MKAKLNQLKKKDKTLTNNSASSYLNLQYSVFKRFYLFTPIIQINLQNHMNRKKAIKNK